MSNTLRLLMGSAAVCLLASCVESERPLSDLSKAEPDMRLCGVWAKTDERGSVDYLHIGAETSESLDRTQSQIEPGLMRLLHAHPLAAGSRAEQGRRGTFLLHTAWR